MTNFDNIPQEMKDLPQWVVWKRENDTKILYDIKTGRRASSTDPNTWASFDLVEAYADYDGIGFVFTKEAGIVGIDFDGVDDIERNKIAEDMIEMFDSYTEISPSGNGYHIYIKAKKNINKCKNSKLGIEFYDEKRFFTVTGNIIGSKKTVEKRQPELDWFEETFFKKNKERDQIVKSITHDDSKVLELLYKASNAQKFRQLFVSSSAADSYGSRSEADFALINHIAFYTQDVEQIKRIMFQSALVRDKWLREDYLDRQIDGVLKTISETYTPPVEFNISEMIPVVGSDQKVSKLIMKTKDGREKAVKKMSDMSVDDFEEILEHLGYKFKLNKMDDSIVVNGDEYTDIYMGVLAGKLDDLGLSNKKRIDNKIYQVSFKHRFHPIKDYLEGLKWNGKDNISEIAEYIKDDEGLFPFYFKKWIVGAVAKIYEMTDNKVLILNGQQNIGKSYFARWIGRVLEDGKFFSDKDMNANDKDSQLKLAQRWVWELSELSGVVGKSALGNVKQFLTLEDIEVRPAFGHKMIRKPAITSFIGTFNDSSGFLNDPTGSRRFISCTISNIDKNYSKTINPEQIWAQAYKLYKDGFDWKFNEEETVLSEKNNERYVVQDPLDDFLERYFDFSDPNSKTDAEEVRSHIDSMGWKGNPRGYMVKVGIYFKKKGVFKREGTSGKFYQGVVKKII